MKRFYKITIVLSTIIIVFIIPEDKKELKTQNFTFVFSGSIESLSIVELSKAFEDSYSRVSNNLNTNLPVTSRSHRTERDLSSKRERIINVFEVVSFTVYSNLNSLFCSF